MAKSSVKQTKKTAQKTAILEDSVIYRFVVDSAGNFVYLNDTLENELDKKAWRSKHINNVLTINDADAFALKPQIKTSASHKTEAANNDFDFSHIRPGHYEATLKLGSSAKQKITQNFQFDWITAAQKSYLVATAYNENIPEAETNNEDLKTLIKNIQPKSKTSSKSTPKTAKRLKEEELNIFVEMSSELQSIITEDGSFVRFNKNFGRILGYDDAELNSKSFLDIMHRDDRAYVRNAFFTISSAQGAQNYSPATNFESRVKGAAGGYFSIDWQLKNIDGQIFALGRDITDVKNNESRLREKEAQLKEAQALANMGHWHWKVGEEKITWSDELYRIFDRDQDEFSPTIDNLKSFMHRRDIGRVIQAFQRAIIEKRNYDIDFRINKDDGSIRYLNCEGRCEFDDNEEVIALFGIMQDVTERLQHERDLQEAKDAAENAYAAKSRFLANMSHELRTPLNAIIGFSEMMQRQLLGPIGTEKYLDYITGIRESGEHLLDLITDILDMSRIEAGKYELHLEDVNVSKLSRLAVHMMEGRAVDGGIKLSVSIDKEDETLVADRRALMQIMLNLLSNAVKFTDQGGHVSLDVTTNETEVQFTVTDDGIGIPITKIKSITRPFEQVEGSYSRQHEGSGLGLAITKDLVELHSGKLDITSQLGHGTSVKITIPRQEIQRV